LTIKGLNNKTILLSDKGNIIFHGFPDEAAGTMKSLKFTLNDGNGGKFTHMILVYLISTKI
jgi:hypothetical protein